MEQDANQPTKKIYEGWENPLNQDSTKCEHPPARGSKETTQRRSLREAQKSRFFNPNSTKGLIAFQALYEAGHEPNPRYLDDPELKQSYCDYTNGTVLYEVTNTRNMNH